MKMCIAFDAVGMVLMGASAAWSDEIRKRANGEELLCPLNRAGTMNAASDLALSAQLKANPLLEPFKDVMRQFFTKHLSYSAIKDDLIDLDAAEFTEAELKEIAAFYRTPAGKKSIERLPVLMQK